MANSTISWLDFFEVDRRKIIEVVSLIKDQDTRDELGVAFIRDGEGIALADVAAAPFGDAIPQGDDSHKGTMSRKGTMSVLDRAYKEKL